MDQLIIPPIDIFLYPHHFLALHCIYSVNSFLVTHGVRRLLLSAEQSLYDYMESMSEGRLDVEKAMFYWLQMLTAVDYLHNLKIPVIHKDIKGKNILTTIALELIFFRNSVSLCNLVPFVKKVLAVL